MAFSVLSRVYKDEGVRGIYTKVYQRLKYKTDSSSAGQNLKFLSIFTKRDIIGFYDYICYPDRGVMTEPLNISSQNSINWLIPDFGIGSGGHLNIFRFIYFLEKCGFKNNICIVGSHRHTCASSAKALIDQHFFKLQAEVYFGIDTLPCAEFCFATGWTTAYFLRYFNKTKHKLYFVQDFEPSFYAKGSEFSFAEQTYRFGFIGICAGGWLASKLSNDYGMSTHALSFSYDRDLYYPRPVERSRKRRIFCYIRPPTVRRGFETALIALDIVGKKNPDIEFIFAGWDMSDISFNHTFINLGCISLEELPEIYSKCEIALVLSYTNLSLLPLEIMACGCVVVSNEGPNVEWLLNSDNSQLSPSNPIVIADIIMDLLSDPEKLSFLRQKGLEYAKSTSWEVQSEKLVSILKDLTN